MKVAIFDTETTDLIHSGLIPLARQPHLIEFYGCAVDLSTGEVLEEVERLVRPPVKISAESVKITGITDEMVADALPFSFHAQEFKSFLERYPVVIAHNASFDFEMMNVEFERVSLKANWPRLLCTVEQTVHLKGYRLKLQDLHELLFGERFKEAHRARNDVTALTKCAIELYRRGQIYEAGEVHGDRDQCGETDIDAAPPWS